MKRKRLTQIFPGLIPLRTKQRQAFFYLGMRLDGRKYAKTQSEKALPYLLFSSSCPMYNRNTGFPMIYQENKVFNLKLAAKPLDQLMIYPGETFSFCQAVRHAGRQTPYKDGLTVINGKLTTAPGGGLCQLTNLLFWVFLHSPLTVVERHGHAVKDFPEPPSDAPMGVDATVSQGWLDLKVKNETNTAFQLGLTFDEAQVTGSLYAGRDLKRAYAVQNGPLVYTRSAGKIYEEVDVIQRITSTETGELIAERRLYRNKCEIGYPLPAGTPVMEKGEAI